MLKSFIYVLIASYCTLVESIPVQKKNVSGGRQAGDILGAKDIVCGVDSLDDIYYNCDAVNKKPTFKKAEIIEIEGIEARNTNLSMKSLIQLDYEGKPVNENKEDDLAEYDEILRERDNHVPDKNKLNEKKNNLGDNFIPKNITQVSNTSNNLTKLAEIKTTVSVKVGDYVPFPTRPPGYTEPPSSKDPKKSTDKASTDKASTDKVSTAETVSTFIVWYTSPPTTATPSTKSVKRLIILLERK